MQDFFLILHNSLCVCELTKELVASGYLSQNIATFIGEELRTYHHSGFIVRLFLQPA